MRILFYAYEFHPLGGGTGKAVLELFRCFEKEKELTLDFITSSLNNKYEVEKFSDRITIYTVPIGPKPRQEYHIQSPKQMAIYTIRAYLLTWKLIFKHKYDLAHFFGYPGALPTLLFRWKIKYIVSLRGVDVPGYNDKFKKYYFIYKPMARLMWRFASEVVANSEKFRELARETAPKLDIKIIPNGVNINRFFPSEDKHKKFTITAGGTLLNPKKGLDWLIKGFAIFHKKHPDSQLWLFGNGELEATLRELADSLRIKDNVIFRGIQPNDLIAREMQKCHAYCLPSLNEGMNNTTLEAVSTGLPIIITDTGGTKELLHDNGFIVPKNDPTAIAECLTKLYEQPELRAQMGKKSREIAMNFSWENAANAYIELYRGQ